MERRLPAVQRRLRVSTMEAAHERLRNEPHLLPEALAVLLIGVTGFFRDRNVFDALRNVFLPEMIRERKPLRILSAGSSRGHELYSIAMMLADAEALEGSELLGVDCRAEAIANARTGFFPEQDLESVDSAARNRYFRSSAHGWEVLPSVRQHLQWRVENLLANVPSGPWDIVLFRNVAIYLEPHYAHAVWLRLCRNTRPGGIIVTGKADQPPPGLPLERVAPLIYRYAPK